LLLIDDESQHLSGILRDWLTTAATAATHLRLNLFVVEFVKTIPDLVAHAEKFTPYEFLGAGGMRRVVEADVQAVLHLAQESRAVFIGSATNSDHIIPLITQVFINGIGCVVADINVNFFHGSNGLFIQFTGRFGSGRPYGQSFIKGFHKAVGHLAAA